MTVYKEQMEPAMEERELLREARRLLPRLDKDQARIAPLENQPLGSREAFGLFNRRNNFQRPVLCIRAAVVKGLHQIGFVDEIDGVFVISNDAGMWLRRQAATVEPYAEQHQARRFDKREVDGVVRPVIVNDGESPLGWLYRRKDRNGKPMISSAQYQAGERLRSDFERGQLMPSTTSKWGGAAPSRRQRRAAPDDVSQLTDSALASRERVTKALTNAGPEFSGILVDVCCHLIGLSETEKNNGWPQRSGKVILQMGLSCLARHYGIEGDDAAQGKDVGRRFEHWGGVGYRPSLEKWD